MPNHRQIHPSNQVAYPGLPRLDDLTIHIRRERTFIILAGLFIGTLAMLNILGITRFLVLASVGETDSGWAFGLGRIVSENAIVFAVAVGVLPYPLTFLCTDFISELYGRARANWVVFVGLLINAWVLFILWLGTALPGFVPLDAATGMPPPPVFDPTKGASGAYVETGWTLFQVRNLAFGATVASMIAYMAAQFTDVYLFHFWKRLTKGKALWLRNNGSTLISQLVDTSAVILITHFYAHALPIDESRALWPQLGVFIASGYAFKAVAALIDTVPFYLGVRWLSRYLRIDANAEHREGDEAL
jgi:uncharacterized PurR-regulated membrane protein YhhQ (DUF165 family)